MRLTFDAQNAARNQWFIIHWPRKLGVAFVETKAATLPWPLSRNLCV
jgi:hypothetical protein